MLSDTTTKKQVSILLLGRPRRSRHKILSSAYKHGSVEALSSGHSPVILVMDMKTHEHTQPRMDPFTVNWVYYMQLLKQTILGNPNITSVEEIDPAIAIVSQK